MIAGSKQPFIVYIDFVETSLLICQHMWQSRIEIEHYSVGYFERITEFDAL